MYQLYYSPGACSMAVHIVLNECNEAFEGHKVSIQDARPPEFLKINPRGQVPVLVDGDVVIREGLAILVHIMEKANSSLLPKDGRARDEALEWLAFANATMHPSYSRSFFLLRNTKDEAVKEQLMSVSVAMINKLWNEVEDKLGKTKFVAGSQLTAADILLSVIANWSERVSPNIKLGARTKELFAILIARPAYKKALESEQIDYKAAA